MSKRSRVAPIALIADDDEVMQLMLSEAASSAGFTVLVAGDGEQALEMATECRPDIILLDVNMPKMDGFSVCEALRTTKEHELTPIIVVTGNDDTDSVNQAYQCGATDFISKPINWSLMSHRMRYVLRGSQNVKVMRAREKKIHRLAYFDSMTGLPNLERIRDNTGKMLKLAESESAQVALLYLDLDGFKRVNDSFGHLVGDEMLLSIAGRLSTAVESLVSDASVRSMFARVGGDEFIAVVSSQDAKSLATSIAEAWVDCLIKPFVRDGNELYMVPRIGISISPADAADFEELMKCSSMAMNGTKNEATKRFAFFCDSMRTEALERVCIESDLRDALRKGNLEVYYQPKYIIETGEISGVEALLRWHDAERGWISPGTFIPIAEESGLITDINRWVVPTVCKQIRQWADEGLAVPVAINMSATNIMHGDPVSLIAQSCKEHGIDPSMVEVEITESTLMHDVDTACSVLADLKLLGVKLSIDDFGTGYSSLAYLKKFDIDTLKIDRSFIIDVANNSDAQAICRAIIALAKQLSLSVVAEGVETFDQHNWLASRKCDVVQGFLWSKPMPPDELRHLLMESNVIRLNQHRSVASL